MPCSMTEITQKHTSLVLIFEVVVCFLSIYIVVLYDNVTFLGVFCLPSRLLSRLLTTMSIQLLIIICLYTNVIVLEALINTNYRLSHEAYVNVFKTGRFCLRDNNAMVIYMWTKCEQYPSSCIIYIPILNIHWTKISYWDFIHLISLLSTLFWMERRWQGVKTNAEKLCGISTIKTKKMKTCYNVTYYSKHLDIKMVIKI